MPNISMSVRASLTSIGITSFRRLSRPPLQAVLLYKPYYTIKSRAFLLNRFKVIGKGCFLSGFLPPRKKYLNDENDRHLEDL